MTYIYPAKPTSPTKPERSKYSIIIPAAGLGNRAKSLGVKSLIKLEHKTTIIDRQLQLIRQHFHDCEIILVTGFQAKKVMDRTPNDIIKVENERYDETGVVRSIGMGLRAATTDNVIIIYGDVVFDAKILNQEFLESTLITCSSMSENEVGLTADKYAEYMCYGLEDKWAQIVYLTGKELHLFQQMTWDENYHNLFGFEIINDIIKNNGQFHVVHSSGYANDVDCRKDLIKIKRDLKLV